MRFYFTDGPLDGETHAGRQTLDYYGTPPDFDGVPIVYVHDEGTPDEAIYILSALLGDNGNRTGGIYRYDEECTDYSKTLWIAHHSDMFNDRQRWRGYRRQIATICVLVVAAVVGLIIDVVTESRLPFLLSALALHGYCAGNSIQLAQEAKREGKSKNLVRFNLFVAVFNIGYFVYTLVRLFAYVT